MDHAATPEPVAPRKPHTWHRPTGDVDDPYAWLAHRDDPDVIPYLQTENAYSGSWFDEHADLVETLFGEIKSRVQETDLSVPVEHGGWWYVTRTVEGASYPIYCRGRSVDTADDHVMLDGNAEAVALGADGPDDYFHVQTVDASPNHHLLAWSVDTDGSERYRLLVRDLATGTDADDVLEGTSSWGGVAWSGDGEWLFYARPDDQMRPHEIWRHRLGTDPAYDVLVYAEPDERFYLDVSSTRSEQWIILTAASKTSTEVRLIPATDPTATPAVVRPRAADVEYQVDHWGDRFVVVTNLDAPDFRVLTAPVDDPGTWTELVAHVPGRRITHVEPFAGHLAIHEWDRAQQRVRLLFADGGERTIDFGDEPHELELGANPEWGATALRVSYQSLTTPLSVYDEDVVTGERLLRKRTPTPGVDTDVYVSTRTWATASDGTEVPVDVVRHVDTAYDGGAPALVYGYGSYESSLPPWFSVARLSLLDRGVVWALVHPRGGGELGRRWYLDGRLLAKRNTFTDTIACTEHLVAEGFVAGDRIALRGGSAGGLLVGACVTMRPELYAAAIAEVPFVDVVSTMSDPTLPLTVTEWDEWGDPRDEPFASYMLGYSPYDNTVPGAYPAVYVTAGLNDPRVSYHEPAKWVARLRSVRTDPPRLLLMRCEMGAGHGGPSGRYEAWRDEARALAFVLAALGV